jgi:hypothetical protein
VKVRREKENVGKIHGGGKMKGNHIRAFWCVCVNNYYWWA